MIHMATKCACVTLSSGRTFTCDECVAQLDKPPARNVTVGRARTVHATLDNDGYTATCGGSMRRNGHRGEPTPTSDPVTCKACLKKS